ncbi:MAG: histidinol-phosphate transaminase [Eubacterium sp.]|nr:histidinol-phosphate transaminase [Eubacterium sp.]
MSSWQENIRKVTPYVPGEQPQGTDLVKLNTNENPYPPSTQVNETIAKLDTDRYSRYPDPTASELEEALARYHGLKKENFFVGTGSDDVLSTAFLTFFNSKKEIIFPDVTYSFYPVWARVYGIPYREVPLDENYRIRVEDYLSGDVGGIVIANPNAPTGISMPVSEIERIVQANPGCVVIVDEAYVDYGGETALPLLEKYENLLVVRTFSKSRAMAGARIGYAIGGKQVISALYDVAQSINSYTMTYASLKIGVASVEDDEYFRSRINDVVATRERTVKELEKRGFTVLPSASNFIFARPSDGNAKGIFEKLREKSIYVRYFSADRTKEFLRITIGTDEQMDKLFAALDSM